MEFLVHFLGFGGPICVSMQNFVEIGRTVAEILQFILYSKWRPSAILDLWGKFWDDPQRKFDGLYHSAKFGCNRISRFENTKVSIFCTFGQKTHIHVHFWAVLGVKMRKMGSF